MNGKKSKRTHSYPIIEDLIRFIAEKTHHAQGLSPECRVRGAVDSLFGDAEKEIDRRKFKKNEYIVHLMGIVAVMDRDQVNARQATLKYFGEPVIKLMMKRENIDRESILRRYSNRINKNPDKCRNPNAYDFMGSVYGGVPEQSMFLEGGILAEWIIKNEKLLNSSVSNLKKKGRKDTMTC